MQEEINNSSMLKVGTILHGTYRIESYLSSGGVGNTYVATNIEFEEKVAIKEFFMKGVTQRDDNQTTVSVSNAENSNSFLEQKEKFKKEARRIRQLKNEHIVSVHDLFEENGTAYYVMDYVDGENLAERLKKTGRPMTESEVRIILPQILDALKAVHAEKMWHLDLKPANIMLEKGGKVKLIDFGASKQLNAQKGGATTSTAISYTNGYAPREQMEQNYDKFGPWTDIYALGATLYNLLTNKRPPLPSDIDDDESADKHQSLPFPDGISDEMKKLVLLLMHTNRKKRPQSVDELLSEGDKLIKSEDHPNISIEDKVVAPVDSEETIIASSVSEETRNEQYPPNNENDTDAEAASVISYYKNLDSESNDEDSGMTSGTKIILAILIGIIVLFVIIGGKGCGNEAQLPAEQQTEKNELQDNNNEVAPQTSTVKNGYFEESYNDGSSYKGNFKNGVYHGQGTYTWSNGEEYIGNWVDGKRSGHGVYTWQEKRKGYYLKYDGDFIDNEMTGKGTMYIVGGEKYVGDIKNGIFHGYGVYTWPEKRDARGYKYEGEFRNGEMTGKGKMFFVGGSVQSGNFVNGSLNGYGEDFLNDGTVLKGIWKDGVLDRPQ